MVLPEVDEASPDPNSDAFSSDPSSPTYNPDVANNSTDIDTPSVILPSGQALPLWTVPAIRSQFSQNPRYPDPFTSFSVVAKILGYTETSRNNIIASHINHTQICISRPLSSIEVQAEAFYHATRLQIEYKSSAVGIVSFLALAAFRQNAARTRPGFITPYARRVLGESLGNLYIRISRFGVYAALGKLQGSLIGVIVGSNKIKEMSRNDPNIPELRRDKAEFRNWTEEEIKRKLRQRREGGPKEPFFPTSKEIVMRKKQHSGDGEVTGEGEVEENVIGDSRNALLNLEQNPYKRPDDKQPDSGNSSRSADPLSKLFNGPSASSTYSSPSTSSSPGQANPGESSWDRIRRERLQAERENGQTRSGVRVPGSEEAPRVPKTDSFTFSDSDRERQLAQAEAQKDFDARVERERRGETGWGRR